MILFDMAKAICIILVVVGHYVPDGSPTWYIGVHDVIYTFHMPLFMFASGFIYMATKKEIPYKDFLVKKVKRLMVPYLAMSVIVITIKLLTEGNAYVEHPVTVVSYLRMFYLPEAGAFLWFIWALWWMFVLVPLFKTKQTRLVLFVIAMVLHYIPTFMPEMFCLKNLQIMLVYFMLGVVCCDCKDILTWMSRVPSCLVYLLFVGGEIVFLMEIRGGQIAPLLPYVGIAATITLSRDLDRWHRSGNGWLMTVASSSYIIYLFHTTFEGFAKAVVRKLPIFIDTSNIPLFLVNIIVVVACGVVFPILLHKYVLAKTMATKMLFGLK